MQWLSGRLLCFRLRAHRFKSHQRHCVVSLSKMLNPLLITVLTQETSHYLKIVDRNLKHQLKQMSNLKQEVCVMCFFLVLYPFTTVKLKKINLFFLFCISLNHLSNPKFLAS